MFDADGAFSPQYDDSVTEELHGDAAIVAVGMAADTAAFPTLAPDGARTLQADPETLQSSRGWVFAAGRRGDGPGDDHRCRRTGPPRRAHDRSVPAGFAARRLRRPLPVVEHSDVLARQRSHSRQEPLAAAALMAAGPSDFAELEAPLSEAEARAAAGRCLDCGVCSECHECIAACPADAIDLDMRERDDATWTSGQ